MSKKGLGSSIYISETTGSWKLKFGPHVSPMKSSLCTKNHPFWRWWVSCHVETFFLSSTFKKNLPIKSHLLKAWICMRRSKNFIHCVDINISNSCCYTSSENCAWTKWIEMNQKNHLYQEKWNTHTSDTGLLSHEVFACRTVSVPASSSCSCCIGSSG